MNKQTFFSLGILILFLFLSASPVLADTAEEEALPFSYEIMSDHSIQITEWLAKDAAEVIIPASLSIETVTDPETEEETILYDTENGTSYEITVIGDEVFADMPELSSVTFPAEGNIRYIGSCAFQNCPKLQQLLLPASLQGIPYDFLSGSSVSELNVPPQLTVAESGNSFLAGTNVSAVRLDEGRQEIPAYMFSNGENLESVSFCDSLEMIHGNAFSSCTSLKSIELPNVHLESYAFFNCTNLESVKFDSDTGYAGETVLADHAFATCPKLKEIQFSDRLAYIDSYCFYGAESLEAVELPETTLGGWAFSDCKALKSVTFKQPNPDSQEVRLYYIGTYCFNNTALEQVTFSDELAGINSNAFYNLEKLSGTLRIPVSCNIGEQAFYNCSSVQKLIFYRPDHAIPDFVVSGSEAYEPQYAIKSGAFYNCKGLASVEFTEGLSSIGSWAFYGCSSLTAVKLPESLESLGEITSDGFAEGGVFSSCSSLKTAELPEHITELLSDMFQLCTSLEHVQVSSGLTWIGENVFGGCKKLISINRTEQPGHIILPDGVAELGRAAFISCESIVSITAPSVREIRDSVFSGCKSLTTLNLGTPVSAIGEYAFSGCSSLPSFAVPDGIDAIHKGTFSGCTALRQIRLPDSLLSIEYSAFSDCSSLSEIMLPNGLEQIGPDAFSGCQSLTELDIPESVTSIGVRFLAGSGVQSFTLSGSISRIPFCRTDSGGVIIENPSDTVVNAGLLTGSQVSHVEIADGVTSIPDYAFFNTTSAAFNLLQIPASVSAIGKKALGQCASLQAVYFLGNAPAFSDTAFAGSSFSAYYQALADGWETACKNYGGTITWHMLGTRDKDNDLAGPDFSFERTSSSICTVKSTDIIRCWTKSHHIQDFFYLCRDENYLHTQVICKFDSSFTERVVSTLTDLLFRGIEGWGNLAFDTMDEETAEQVLAALIIDAQSETENCAEMNSAAQIETAICGGTVAYFTAQNEEAAGVVLGNLFKNDTAVKEAVMSGSVSKIKTALKGKPGISRDKLNRISEVAADYRWSNTFSSALDGLSIAQTACNYAALSYEQVQRWLKMKEANDIYIDILQAIKTDAQYEPLRNAASALQKAMRDNASEAELALVGKLSANAAAAGASIGVDQLLSRYAPTAAIAKLGWDAGAGLSNLLLHTSDQDTAKDQMRICTAAGWVVKSLANTQVNRAIPAAFQGTVDADETCMKAVAYAKILLKIRNAGECSYRNLLHMLFQTDSVAKACSVSYEISGRLREIDRMLFDNSSIRRYLAVYGFRCPVDVSVRDSSGKLIATLKDGVPDAGNKDTVAWEVLQNEFSGDYEKYIYAPADMELKIEAAANADGAVHYLYFGLDDEGSSIIDESLEIPVKKGQILTTDTNKPLEILAMPLEEGGSGNTAAEILRYTLADLADSSAVPSVETISNADRNQDSQPAKPKDASLEKVEKTRVSSIELNAAPSLKIAAGKKVYITAAVLPAAAGHNLIWTVSNGKYASVSKSGVVTTKKAGKGKTVTVTAKATDGSGKQASVKIKIMKGAIKKISIKGKKSRSLKAGKKLKLKASVKASKGANKKLRWSSSNENYATVNARGTVKSKKAGRGKTVTITAYATDGTGRKARIKIRLK